MDAVPIKPWHVIAWACVLICHFSLQSQAVSVETQSAFIMYQIHNIRGYTTVHMLHNLKEGEQNYQQKQQNLEMRGRTESIAWVVLKSGICPSKLKSIQVTSQAGDNIYV
jgi:hypothetical protein